MFKNLFGSSPKREVVGYDITPEEYELIMNIRSMGKAAFAMQNLGIDPDMYRDYFSFINSSPIDFLRTTLNLKGEKFKEFMELCHAFFVHENQENKINGLSEWKNIPIPQYVEKLEELVKGNNPDKYLELVTLAYRIYFLKNNESPIERRKRYQQVLEQRAKLSDDIPTIEIE